MLLLDGAQYHLSAEIKNHLGVLEFPVIFTGPRSYDAAPCELLFAQLKSTDINPSDLKTGKR